MMPWGKYKGLPLRCVPLAYLDWVLRLEDMDPEVLAAVAAFLTARRAELRQWKEEADAEIGDLGLPPGEPGIVCGVELNATESGILQWALQAGQLIVTPDMPRRSRVVEAWQAVVRLGRRRT